MAINVDPSGKYDVSKKKNTNLQTYTYFSGEITTTNLFTDNKLEPGVPLGEIILINRDMTNWAAFQFEELDGTNKASGVIPPGSVPIVFRRANKTKINLRSLVDGAAATVYVFGI